MFINVCCVNIKYPVQSNMCMVVIKNKRYTCFIGKKIKYTICIQLNTLKKYFCPCPSPSISSVSRAHLNVAADDGQLHAQPQDDPWHKRVPLPANLRQMLTRDHAQLGRQQLHGTMAGKIKTCEKYTWPKSTLLSCKPSSQTLN